MKNVLNLREHEMEHMPSPSIEETDASRAWGVLGFAVVAILIGFMFSYQPAKAKAQDEYVLGFPKVHQNDYYCQQIKDSGIRVAGATGSIAELCAEYGITL